MANGRLWTRSEAVTHAQVMFLYLVGGAVGSAAFLYQEYRQLPSKQPDTSSNQLWMIVNIFMAVYPANYPPCMPGAGAIYDMSGPLTPAAW